MNLKLTYGTYATVLNRYCYSLPKNHLQDLLFSAIDNNPNPHNRDDASVSKYFSCKSNVSISMRNCAKEASPAQVASYFQEHVLHHIAPHDLPAAYRGILQLIQGDDKLALTTALYAGNRGTKDELLSQPIPQDLEGYAIFLANIFIYCVLYTVNTDAHGVIPWLIKELKKGDFGQTLTTMPSQPHEEVALTITSVPLKTNKFYICTYDTKSQSYHPVSEFTLAL